MESGILVDSQCLVLLFSCTQLLYRELQKTARLIDTMPMDMSAYYGELIPPRAVLDHVRPLSS